MSPSPIANRSFLHGDGKTSPSTSPRMIYATLDSLALKRTRLPLRLLPIVDSDGTEKRSIGRGRDKGSDDTCPSAEPRYSEGHSERNPQGICDSDRPIESEKSTETKSANTMYDMVGCGTEHVYGKVNFAQNVTYLDDAKNANTGVSNIAEGVAEFVEDQPFNIKHVDTIFKILNRPSSFEPEDSSIWSITQEALNLERRASNSSSDYESIDITNCIDNVLSGFEENSIMFENSERSIVSGTSTEEGQILRTGKRFEKSKSTNDLWTKNSGKIVEMAVPGRMYLTEEDTKCSEKSQLFVKEQSHMFVQKKRYFARNVFHFVPGRLGKRPNQGKKKKKAKKKKQHKFSSSLSSLKSLPADSKAISNSFKPKCLSREELKYLTISLPTNFVHVASATNPNLISNENAERSDLERVVITHEEKCATLPLLVKKDFDWNVRNKSFQRAKDATRIHTDDATATFHEERTVQLVGKENDKTIREEVETELPRSSKVLEESQEVKRHGENEGSPYEETCYETMCEFESTSVRCSPRANSSFLWGGQPKEMGKSNKNEKRSQLAPRENDDETDAEQYDDVGVAELSQDVDYDDAGSPPISKNENEEAKSVLFNLELYDDVVSPNVHKKSPFSITLREKHRPSLAIDGKAHKHCRHNAHETGGVMQGDQNEEDYLSINDEYSIVDEDLEEGEEEQDVYDDVGLPSQERVNSLYAGFTPGSVLRMATANSKESEWEDLEDPVVFPYSAPKMNSCIEVTEGQVQGGRRKSGRGWSQKVRRQRSRGSRKSEASKDEEFTTYVTVSLGSGSVLLVGNTKEPEAEWKMGDLCDRDAPIDSPLQRTQGLVQLRVVDLDEDMDTQETSCYVHEDGASDDNTYETLYSLQPDDFSTDTDSEATEMEDRKMKDDNRNVYNEEAPTRPVPPSPREPTLTQTLGRRIKMLRRTWSITKGSLGRIRKRASIDDDHGYERNKGSYNEHQVADGRKYFSFRRHFRKNATTLSTFYLDGDLTKEEAGLKNNNNSADKDAIYTNWYKDGTPADSSLRISKDSLDHYSVLVEQEPLYQFYAAAAARIAFDLDSDGYEEVEDTILATTTMNVTKPGHRTLWSQTPQVITSGLLQKLTSEEKKIQEAKFEILTSEASYLNSLRVLEREFLNDSTLTTEILTSNEKEQLFGGIPDVLHTSEKFLMELETVWKRDPMLQGLPEVLLKHAEKSLGIYVSYCSNQVSIDTTLKQLRARKGSKFLETISQIETHTPCQNLSLHSFLMLPMQRVTRLPLLADAVLSKLAMEHTDRLHWERVLSSLSNVVAECNEGARAAVQEAEMEALARKLEFPAKIKPISFKGKCLVRSGIVVQLSIKADVEYKLTFGKKFNKTPLYLLLLTDYLLVTKPKSSTHDEIYTVMDVCKRNLVALEPVSEDSLFAGRNAMILTLLENQVCRQVEYVLTCGTDTERERWLEAVSPPKRGIVGETLYETWDCPQVMALYPYTPNQPDELPLQPGDIINVLRKMADGWYHGEKLMDGERGWFPGNYAKEVASEHVRARNLKQRHRLLALSGSVLQRRTKRQIAIR